MQHCTGLNEEFNAGLRKRLYEGLNAEACLHCKSWGMPGQLCLCLLLHCLDLSEDHRVACERNKCKEVAATRTIV